MCEICLCATLTLKHAAKSRNRTDQRSERKQWFGVARGLKFVMSIQENDWVRFLYLAGCTLNVAAILDSTVSRNNLHLFCI